MSKKYGKVGLGEGGREWRELKERIKRKEKRRIHTDQTFLFNNTYSPAYCPLIPHLIYPI